MMTLDEAREHIGDAVVYDPGYGGGLEDGTIYSVNESYVFVQFGHNDTSIRGALASDLSLLFP